MKIAVFHNIPLGGARRMLLEQVKLLRKKHAVDLYEFKSVDRSFMDVSQYANKVYRYKFTLDNNYKGFINRLVRDYRNFFTLRTVHKKIADDINKRKYDVALVHTDMLTESPFVLRYLTVPSVYHCHELLRIAYEKELAFNEDVLFIKTWYENATRFVRKMIDLINAKSATKIITSSNYIAGKVAKVYGVKAIVCHPGVNLNTFKPKKGKKGKDIVYVGGRNKMKGYDLIESLIKLFGSNSPFRIVEFGFLNGDTLVKNDQRLAKQYAESFLTICPARSEPLGLVQLESMACGTPVLAVDEGGYKETIVDGVTGYLLKRNARLFYKKILLLSKDRAKYNKMSKEGRLYVAKNYNWREHAQKLDAVLTQLVNENKSTT